MRKILLLFLISVAAAGQKQITDLSGRVVETAYPEPAGRIGNDFFYLNTHSISKINLGTWETSRVTSAQNKNRSYASLVSHGRLFYAFIDLQYELIINEIDPRLGEVINSFSFPNSYYLSKINDVFHIISEGRWVRISFDESEMYTEEIFTDAPAYSGGSPVKNRVIKVKNKADETVKGFWDDHNNFIITKDIEEGLVGEELPGYYVFYRVSNPERAFVYHKNTGKEISVEPSAPLAFLRLFEGEPGELYFLESFESFSEEPGVLYKMYRLTEEGNKIHVMDIELKDYNFYMTGGGIFGPGNGTPYSNILYFNKHIYFWAGDSKWNSSPLSMKLVAVNLETREVITKPLPEEAVKALQLSHPPYGLQLMASGGKVVAVTDTEDYLSITCTPPDFTFMLEKRGKILQKNVVAVNDTLHLNFSYRQRIIVEDSNRHLLRVIGDSTWYDTDAISSYYATPGKLIIPDDFHARTYVYDGETLRSVPDPVNESYLRLALVYWTGIKVYNKYLVYAHGQRPDGTTGGDYYAFDSNTDQMKKVFSFNASYDTPAYAAKANMGEFVLIDLDEGKYVITDLEDSFELNLPNTASGVELISNFNNKTFLLKWYEAGHYGVYHFNPGSGVVRTTGIAGFGGRFYGRNSFYTYEKGMLIKIDENGGSETIIGPDGSLYAEKTSADEVVFFNLHEFGKIELASGDIIRQKVKTSSWPLVKVFKLDNRHFGILSDGELVRIDFNTGNFNKIASERFVFSSESTGNKVYLTRYDAISRETEVWEFNGKDVRERFRFDNRVYHGSFSQPVLFHSSEHAWQLWWPADERVIKLDSAVLENYWEFRYLGETKDVGYFTGRGNTGNHVISINARSKQVTVLFEGGEHFQVSDEQLFIGNEEGIWKSNKEGTLMTHETQLKLVNVRYNSYDARNFLEFRNNLYFWSRDEKGTTQLYRLTDKAPENILLPTENSTLHFSFYPNPTTGYLNISSTAERTAKYKITVLSPDGKVLSEKESALPQKLDLSGFKAGIYLIHVRSGQESKTFRVVRSE